MAGSIGSLVLRLGVFTGDFDRQLDRSIGKAERTGRALVRALTIPQKLLASKLGLGIFSGLAQGARGLLGGIPFVGGALSSLLGGGEGLASHLKSEMLEMVQTGREAQRLGVSVETLAGLQYLAIGSSQSMGRAMFHLWHELGMASTGSKEAAGKFAALGLNARELSALPLDQAFGKIADTIRGLPGGVEQATAAYELFGRRGEELLPVLLKGSAGMEEARRKARDMGLAFSAVDMANVEKAVLSLRQIEGTVTGVFRQAAIGVAPYVEALGGQINKLVSDAGGVGPAVAKAFDFIGEAAAGLLDTLGDVADSIKEIKGLGTAKGKLDAFSSLISPMRNARRGYDFLKELFSDEDAKKAGERMTGGLGDTLRKHLAAVRSHLSSTSGAGPGLAELALGNDIGALNEELRKEIATLGLSKDAVKLWELEQRGATGAQTAATRGLIEQRDRLEALSKSYKEGRGIVAGFAADLELQRRRLLGLGDFGGRGAEVAIKELKDKSLRAFGEMQKAADKLGGLGFADEAASGPLPENKALADKITAYKQAKKVFEDYEKQLKALDALETSVEQRQRTRLFERGLEIQAKGRTPVQRLRDELKDLEELLSAVDDKGGRAFGFFGKEDYGRGVLSALGEAEKALGIGGEVRLAGAAEYNTAASQEIINRFNAMGTQPQTVEGRLDAIRRAQENADQNTQRLLKEVIRALEKSGPIKVRGN